MVPASRVDRVYVRTTLLGTTMFGTMVFWDDGVWDDDVRDDVWDGRRLGAKTSGVRRRQHSNCGPCWMTCKELSTPKTAAVLVVVVEVKAQGCCPLL